MANSYKSFYLDDLLLLIDKVALNNQKEPNMMMMGRDETQLYLLQNASTAAYNRGIIKMREALIKALNPEEADPDG